MKPSDQRNALMSALRPYYTGQLDGVLGPMFDRAVGQLRAAADPEEAAGSALLQGNPRLAMVAELRKLIGGRETDGANQSPEIDKLWQYTSYPEGWKDRAPYCAATICAVAHRAAEVEPLLKKSPLPTDASVANLLDWARQPQNKCLVFTDPSKAQAGDIVCFLPHFSHIGLQETNYDGSGYQHTLEGNTNGAGARDGDGFWAKLRSVNIIGHYIRLAARA